MQLRSARKVLLKDAEDPIFVPDTYPQGSDFDETQGMSNEEIAAFEKRLAEVLPEPPVEEPADPKAPCRSACQHIYPYDHCPLSASLRAHIWSNSVCMFLSVEVLRRMQFSLKSAAKTGEACPDGQMAVRAKRGRKPKVGSAKWKEAQEQEKIDRDLATQQAKEERARLKAEEQAKEKESRAELKAKEKEEKAKGDKKNTTKKGKKKGATVEAAPPSTPLPSKKRKAEKEAASEAASSSKPDEDCPSCWAAAPPAKRRMVASPQRAKASAKPKAAAAKAKAGPAGPVEKKVVRKRKAAADALEPVAEEAAAEPAGVAEPAGAAEPAGVAEAAVAAEPEKMEVGEDNDLMMPPKVDSNPPLKVPVICFARRYRPKTPFGSKKWNALRDAFEQKVKPRLKWSSKHEDTSAASENRSLRIVSHSIGRHDS